VIFRKKEIESSLAQIKGNGGGGKARGTKGGKGTSLGSDLLKSKGATVASGSIREGKTLCYIKKLESGE